MVRDNVSLSSQWLILPTPIADKCGVPTAICAALGGIGKGSLQLTRDHNFSALKTNVNLCCQMLK